MTTETTTRGWLVPICVALGVFSLVALVAVLMPGPAPAPSTDTQACVSAVATGGKNVIELVIRQDSPHNSSFAPDALDSQVGKRVDLLVGGQRIKDGAVINSARVEFDGSSVILDISVPDACASMMRSSEDLHVGFKN